MWTYSQTSGELKRDGSLVGIGYSGHGAGVNNPDLESVHDVGPVPRGLWIIGAQEEHSTHGPCVMPLSPKEGTDTLGRSEFLMHGDLLAHPGERLASLGCIIMPKYVREQVAASPDRDLEVTL